jgi:nitrate reductase alpha subunit
MLYYVMWGTEIVAVCTRPEDAHAMAGFDYKTKKTYTVVAKMVDNTVEGAIV